MTDIQNYTTADLKTIKGIAKTRETWLHEIGVHNIEDLAASDVVEISHRLQTAGHSTPLIVIEDWITKAKTHMSAIATAPTAQTVPAKLAPAFERKEKVASPAEWQTFAEFFVDYQRRLVNGEWEQRTKVHRMRNGGKDELWEGLVGEPAGRWMLAQLGEIDFASAAVGKRPSISAKATPAVNLLIQEAELTHHLPGSIPVRLDKTGHMFTHPAYSKTPFDLDVIFELLGNMGANNGNALRFSMETYATNKTTGETIPLGESEPLPFTPGQTRYIIKLPGARLPQGLYRLQLMVRALELPGVLGFLEVPFLQVV